MLVINPIVARAADSEAPCGLRKDGCCPMIQPHRAQNDAGPDHPKILSWRVALNSRADAHSRQGQRENQSRYLSGIKSHGRFVKTDREIET